MAYVGTIFERLNGLDELICQSTGMTVADICCADGLIAYEFAKAGAKHVYGLDINHSDINFARRLFSKTGIPHEFVCADITQEYRNLNNQFDIVLYLGHYHHLKGIEKRKKITTHLIKLSKKFFAIRTTLMTEFDQIKIEKMGFIYKWSVPATRQIGGLKVFKKI
jgi:2-polyprenyl-3-methyl-5-hydroxy-6-metoxy-1,4-benzoquinol methylase